MRQLRTEGTPSCVVQQQHILLDSSSDILVPYTLSVLVIILIENHNFSFHFILIPVLFLFIVLSYSTSLRCNSIPLQFQHFYSDSIRVSKINMTLPERAVVIQC